MLLGLRKYKAGETLQQTKGVNICATPTNWPRMLSVAHITKKGSYSFSLGIFAPTAHAALRHFSPNRSLRSLT